ncbi:ATP-dependent RNA helicase dbp9 [Symbiodinium microadriaticum]|uniref:RNA helicase n=1 Tax=Symbiodinium microadriaticum TaxID=2951 RepID=A0A1Q9CIE6_SYMMI|nr:ATP-dependent RNA helicase dbp9 [Symbiodinium microadriaticum]
MSAKSHAPSRARERAQRCPALLLDAAPLPPPHPGEFARNLLWKRGLMVTDRKIALARLRRRCVQRENCFPLGRFAEQQDLTCERGRGICSATKELPAILKEWKVLRRQRGAATSYARELRNCQEGVEEFLSDATAAMARLLHRSPAKLRRRVHAAVQRDWQVMRPQHQLLFLATAAQRALDRTERVGMELAVCETLQSRSRQVSESSSGLRQLLQRAPASSELYGEGPDSTFRHPFVKELLLRAQARVSWEPWVICVRSYARPKSLMSQTMKVLRCSGLLEYWDRIHVFVSHEDPDFLSGCYEEVLGQLHDRIIVGVKGADLQVRFIEECFLPGQHVVVMDDNLLRFVRHEAGEEFPGDLVATIEAAAEAMQRFQAHLWGISPTSNKKFLKEAPEISTALGLVYGALFGFRVLHDPDLYTRFGQVKDDLERSLRYWHRDGVVVRFRRMSCTKAQRPGVYASRKGGISASIGETGHKLQGDFALARLAERFSQYIRLPNPEIDQKRDPTTGAFLTLSSKKPCWKAGSHVADCGVVWMRKKSSKSTTIPCGPWALAPTGSKLLTGFCCRACRGESDSPCHCIDPVEEEARQLFFLEGLEGARAAARLPALGSLEERALRALEQEWRRLPRQQRAEMKALAARDLEQKQWCPCEDSRRGPSRPSTSEPSASQHLPVRHRKRARSSELPESARRDRKGPAESWFKSRPILQAVMAAEASRPPKLELEKAQEEAQEEDPAVLKARAASYGRALQLCACCPGKEKEGLKWLDDMQDNRKLQKEISMADLLAALHLCEACDESLLRVFTLLVEMHDKNGFVLDTPLESHEGEGQEGVSWLLDRFGEDVWEALERHADSWLLPATQSVQFRGAASGKFAPETVRPILEALDSPSPAAMVKLRETPDLGAFTADAFRSAEAARQLRRQAMLDKWSQWSPPPGPGSLAWLAYDLTDQAGSLCSDGEVHRRRLERADTDALQPLEEKGAAVHAERAALIEAQNTQLALTERLLRRHPGQGGCDVSGVTAREDSANVAALKGLSRLQVVLLYSPSPPGTAGIFTAREFLRPSAQATALRRVCDGSAARLFPKIEMRVAFGDAMDLGEDPAKRLTMAKLPRMATLQTVRSRDLLPWMKPLQAFTGLFRKDENQEARTDQRKSSLKKVDKSFKDAGRSGQRLRFDTERVNTANLAEQDNDTERDSKAAPKCAKDAVKDSSREGFGGPIRAQPMQATRNRDDELSCHVTAAYMSELRCSHSLPIPISAKRMMTYRGHSLRYITSQPGFHDPLVQLQPGPMETLAMGTLNNLHTLGVGVACTAFVMTELQRRFELTTVDLKSQSLRILCRSLPETCALAATLLVALALRLFSNPDRNVSADPVEIQVWEQIKQEWPILMGADTLLAVQAMLRLLVWVAVVLRMSQETDGSPLAGASSTLYLAAAGARSLLSAQTSAYGLDGPLGGSFAVFCEVTSGVWLAALCSKVGRGSWCSGAFFAMAAWAASRHYLNLSGAEPGGDYSNDRLFILAHCLEFFGSMAFLARSFRTVAGEPESIQAQALNTRRVSTSWDGFVYLLLAAQQALPAYYFLTAFAPCQRLVGEGRPFCLLIMANLLQLAFLLCALAFCVAGLLGVSTVQGGEPAVLLMDSGKDLDIGAAPMSHGPPSLLDEKTSWAEFGKQHLDRRLTKALTDTLRLQRPTLVQSRGIPVALEGKDLLCRARTGSGKTLCYAIPLVQRLLQEVEAKGSATPLSGLILVPTKELIAQVHRVVTSLLSFCFDVLTVDILLSGDKYSKAELPVMLVTTPSSLLALVKQREARGAMKPLSETLKVLILDEADLMFSYGYEEDVKALCALMPPKYQAMLVSATLSEEVEQLKGLMLHKPVVLKLEEPRVTGKLTQFYFVCHKTDKYLIIYTLLKLQLIQGKTLIFVQSVEAAYRLKILLERFSINSAVLNSELPHASRQNIIDSFNQGAVELLVATDEGLGGNEEEVAEGWQWCVPPAMDSWPSVGDELRRNGIHEPSRFARTLREFGDEPARLNAFGIPLAAAASMRASQLLGGLNVQNTTNTLWTFAAVVHWDAALLQGISKEVIVKMNEIDSRSPGNIARWFARLLAHGTLPLQASGGRALAYVRTEFAAQSTSNSVRTFAQPKLSGQRFFSAMGELGTRILPTVLELSQHSERSACTARAFGLSDSQGTRLLTATASTSAARLGDFGPLSLVSLALASARTTWRGEALLQATAARASAKAQQPSPQGLGNLAWGMATALVPDKSSLEVLTLEATAKVQELGCQLFGGFKSLFHRSFRMRLEIPDTANAVQASARVHATGLPLLDWTVISASPDLLQFAVTWGLRGLFGVRGKAVLREQLGSQTEHHVLDAVSMGFLMMLALWEKDVAADQTLLLAMMSSLTLRLPLLQVETPWTRVDVGFEAFLHRRYHKVVRLMDFMAATGTCSAKGVVEACEAFASSGQRQWLKVAGEAKAQVIEASLALRRAPERAIVAEFGSFVGYSCVRMAWRAGCHHVVSLESDAVHVLVARHVVALAGLSHCVEIMPGMAHDALDRLVEALRGRILADNTLKPGAPEFLWLLCKGSAGSGSNGVALWSLPEFLTETCEGEDDEMEEDEEEEEEEEECEDDALAEDVASALPSASTPRRSALRKSTLAGTVKADAGDEEEEQDDEAEEEEEADEDEEVEPVRPAKAEAKAKPGRRRMQDEQYSLTRGVDLQGVTTVLNADVPTSVRDYVHRVGRCARGGQSGTALTICTHEEQPMLQKIIQAQSRTGTGLQALPMQISDAERFRYRVEDMARGLTKKAISKYRARELQMEALHSEKLKAYFEEHPDDKRALQRMQRALRERKSVRQHLKSIPSYLVPEAFQKATPVQKAVREANASAGKPTSAVRRKRLIKAKQQDPLKSFDTPGVEKRRDRFTRDRMIAKERRMDPATTNVEALPPLSRHKLWKLQHGKRIRKPMDVLGERRRLTPGQRKRRKKFG